MNRARIDYSPFSNHDTVGIRKINIAPNFAVFHGIYDPVNIRSPPVDKVNKSTFICGYVHVDEVPRSNIILIKMIYPRILMNLGGRHIIHIAITLYVSSSTTSVGSDFGRH